MATMTIEKKELPELESPLDYPACLDRIIQAAENRADYEIAISKFARMALDDFIFEYFDKISNIDKEITIKKGRSVGMSTFNLKL